MLSASFKVLYCRCCTSPLAALFLLLLFLSEFVGALWEFIILLSLGNYIDVTKPHSSQRTAEFMPYAILRFSKQKILHMT